MAQGGAMEGAIAHASNSASMHSTGAGNDAGVPAGVQSNNAGVHSNNANNASAGGVQPSRRPLTIPAVHSAHVHSATAPLRASRRETFESDALSGLLSLDLHRDSDGDDSLLSLTYNSPSRYSPPRPHNLHDSPGNSGTALSHPHDPARHSPLRSPPHTASVPPLRRTSTPPATSGIAYARHHSPQQQQHSGSSAQLRGRSTATSQQARQHARSRSNGSAHFSPVRNVPSSVPSDRRASLAPASTLASSTSRIPRLSLAPSEFSNVSNMSSVVSLSPRGGPAAPAVPSSAAATASSMFKRLGNSSAKPSLLPTPPGRESNGSAGRSATRSHSHSLGKQHAGAHTLSHLIQNAVATFV